MSSSNKFEYYFETADGNSMEGYIVANNHQNAIKKVKKENKKLKITYLDVQTLWDYRPMTIENYVVCEGYAYWEKDGNYYTTTVDKKNNIQWADATRIDIKSTSGIDITNVHQLYDSLHSIKTSQRQLLNETRKIAV